ncbi:hypothetical protein DFH06DRAFT_1110415 [Mycena polygramma]|nr:hypothetical protein DFH06DRAFT_1110415 [Mycena polygramma]
MSLRPLQVATLAAETCDPQPPLTSATLRYQLAEIDSRIARLEAQLDLLHTERRAASDALNSVVYPVLRIPPELTTQILEYYVYGGRALEQHDGLIRNLLTVTGVCRLWRAITVSCGALWNRVYMNVSNDVDRKVKLLQMWLSRSGDLPLHLDLTIYQSTEPETQADALLPLLRAEWSRCKSLRLWSITSHFFPVDTAPFRFLTKVDLAILGATQWTAITTFLNTPLLREAHIDTLSLPQISLPWAQLTDLRLSRQTLPQCFEILEQTPNLEMLSIRHPTASRNTIVALPHILRRLHRIECLDVVLNHLILPILDTLTLDDVSPETGPRVKALVNRSGCTLRVLRLKAPTVDAAYECITSLPSLRELSLTLLTWSHSEFEEFFSYMADDLDDYEYLPELTSLNLHVRDRYIDVCSLTNMLFARWTGRSESAAKLKSFTLSFDTDDIFDLEIPVARLREMRRGGLEIDIRSKQKWTTQYFDSQMVSEIMK